MDSKTAAAKLTRDTATQTTIERQIDAHGFSDAEVADVLDLTNLYLSAVRNETGKHITDATILRAVFASVECVWARREVRIAREGGR